MSECVGQECCDTVYTDCPYVPDDELAANMALDSDVNLAPVNEDLGAGSIPEALA